MKRILLVDDDIELCSLLNEYILSEGFSLTSVHTAEEGIRQAISGEYGFVILDVMLPGGSGFEVLRTIRKTSKIPVLMLTARGEEIDRIVGLEMGADDYLAKPFNPRELMARIKAVYRRLAPESKEISESGRISLNDITLDPRSQTVMRGNDPILVTTTEFSLLHELMRKAGQVVSREDLAAKALGRRLSLFDRSIDVHVSSLRKKLGKELDGCDRIKAIRGVGYLYTVQEAGVISVENDTFQEGFRA